MSERIDRAHPGDPLELVVDADDGDGHQVAFAILAGGDTLATVTAAIHDGQARATWRADAHDRELPLELTFRASCGEATADAGSLWLDPPGAIGTPAWLLLGRGGTPGELVLLEPSAATAAAQAPAAREPYRELVPGDQLGLLTDVCAPDGTPLAGDLELTFVLHKQQADQTFAPVATYVRSLSAPHGVRVVAARWTMDTLGLPPPYRYRFVVSWKRRPGETATPAAARSPLTSRTA